VAAAISFVFWKWILYILILPAGDINLIFTELTEMIGTIMRVCLASGLVLATPYVTIQAILFIRPALTKKEERYVYIILPWIALMFAGGVVFGYFILRLLYPDTPGNRVPVYLRRGYRDTDDKNRQLHQHHYPPVDSYRACLRAAGSHHLSGAYGHPFAAVAGGKKKDIHHRRLYPGGYHHTYFRPHQPEPGGDTPDYPV